MIKNKAQVKSKPKVMTDKQTNEYLIKNRFLIYNIAKKCVKSNTTHLDMEDVVQECFCQALAILRKHTQVRGELGGFLHMILIRDMVCYLRMHSRYIDYPQWVGIYWNKFKKDRKKFIEEFTSKWNASPERMECIARAVDVFAYNRSYNEPCREDETSELLDTIDIKDDNEMDIDEKLDNRKTIEDFSNFIKQYDKNTQWIINHKFGLNGEPALMQKDIIKSQTICEATINSRIKTVIKQYKETLK